MFDIVGVGELLIDFTPIKINGTKGFVPNPGGAPCNFLTMAAHSGAKTAFIGKVGKDNFGDQLKSVIEQEGIDARNLIQSGQYSTTLAFVHLSDQGERSFSFYRKGCADVMLEESEVDYELLEATKAVHFGSLSFTDEPSRSTVHRILAYAKERNKLITYDPNYRPALWGSESDAKQHMLSGFEYANIIKVSEEELQLLTDEADIQKACAKLMVSDVRLIVVTLGEKGAYYHTPHQNGYVDGFEATVIDTTGAGDSFFGALVSKVVLEAISLENADVARLEEAIRFANAAASLCIESYGGIPAMPSNEAVMARMRR